MSSSSKFSRSILLLCAVTLISAQSNTSNTSSSLFRNVEVGLKVSNLWYSGSTDDLYFQICNNAATEQCLPWYLIENGLPNRGEWYYYNYTNISIALTPFRSLKLMTFSNDQLCVSAVSIDGETVSSSTGDCIEVGDSRPPGSCSVIDAVLPDIMTNTAFNTNGPEFCPYDVSGAIVAPPTPTANGTRTYSIALEVSNVPFSGTNNDLYLRLCTDAARTDCTRLPDSDCATCHDWFVFGGGLADEEGVTYTAEWNTADIGDVGYADIVIFGSNDFCLSSLRVDDVEADAGNIPECIGNSVDGGCTTLAIDLGAEEFTESETEVCAYGLTNNNTAVYVTDYKFEFKTGSLPGCGCEATVFFIFCNAEGSAVNDEFCSEIYEIGGQLGDYGTRYEYTVSVEEYALFNTISDVFRVFVWTSSNEYWCLSDIWIDGVDENGNDIEGVNVDSTPATNMDTGVDRDEYCTGVQIAMGTNVWEVFSDGPEATGAQGEDVCRWQSKLDEEGAVSVSKMKASDGGFLDWMNSGYNWIYICVGLIGLVICCICGCAVAQKLRVKDQVITANKNQSWHGGRTY